MSRIYLIIKKGSNNKNFLLTVSFIKYEMQLVQQRNITNKEELRSLEKFRIIIVINIKKIIKPILKTLEITFIMQYI